MKLINFYTPYPQKRGHSNSHHSRNWQSFNNPSFLLIWHISLVLYFWIVPVLSTMLCMKSFIIWSSSNILHFNLPNYSPRSLLACIFGSDCFHLMYHTPLGLLLNFLLPVSFASFFTNHKLCCFINSFVKLKDQDLFSSWEVSDQIS